MLLYAGVVTATAPKKTDQIFLRLDGELGLQFGRAVKASGLSPQDALRMGAQAMVTAFLKFGKIPRDMEIRQAQIGDPVDMQDLLRRAVAIGEKSQAPYLIEKPPKPPVKSRKHGAGPDVDVRKPA